MGAIQAPSGNCNIFKAVQRSSLYTSSITVYPGPSKFCIWVHFGLIKKTIVWLILNLIEYVRSGTTAGHGAMSHSNFELRLRLAERRSQAVRVAQDMLL